MGTVAAFATARVYIALVVPISASSAPLWCRDDHILIDVALIRVMLCHTKIIRIIAEISRVALHAEAGRADRVCGGAHDLLDSILRAH